MLNLSLVKTLLSVARTRSFRDTAENLGLSQPAVSQHIRKLEEELGVMLIRRDRRGCEPTQAALAFLPFAESLLRLSERARAAVKLRQLRIGAGSNIGIYILQPLLKSFIDTHPGLDLDLVIDSNPAVAARLETSDLDLALMEWWDGRSGFNCVDWRREPVVLIVPPDHPLSGRRTISREELIGAPMLGGEPGTGTGRLLQSHFGREGLPAVRLHLGSTEAVKQAVAAGIGISLVLASAVQRETATGELCAIPFAEPAPAKELYAIWPRFASPSGKPPPFVRHLLHNGG
jgi:DNA-binding transcriptional LysR family regulator